MQRPQYSNIPPAQSPPLHHPVPQHVSTVPQLRSPPPPAAQQQPQQAGYGYTPQQGQQAGMPGGGAGNGNYMHPAFGNFMNDSTAQMGFQVGKSAVMAGQEYMEQNFNRYVNVSALKHYFNVSNSYVASKVRIVLFPWRHRPWSRHQQSNGQDVFFLPPRDDINSPDMYIPVMAFVTYILLSTLLAGIHGAFRPELLGLTATNAFAVVIIELILLKLGTYLLNISNESQWLDLVAYSGYKFVGVILTVAVSGIFSGVKWISWLTFAYAYAANAFFLLRSLKYVLLPDNTAADPSRSSMQAVGRSQRNRRTQFLFLYSTSVTIGALPSMVDFLTLTGPDHMQPGAAWRASPTSRHPTRPIHLCRLNPSHLGTTLTTTPLHSHTRNPPYHPTQAHTATPPTTANKRTLPRQLRLRLRLRCCKPSPPRRTRSSHPSRLRSRPAESPSPFRPPTPTPTPPPTPLCRQATTAALPQSPPPPPHRAPLAATPAPPPAQPQTPPPSP
ncbi:Protein transport protein yif1 [Zalaria obscura]|uniref:Protein transport protein yif1 n=1 Tax=Zalaria obscura TaxID=2024903 RepID=A0ACC3SFS7_9PEZI